MQNLVPIVLFISLFGMIFGIFYIRSRENMAMLEKGFNPRINNGRATSRLFFSLKFGLLLVGAGLGLFTAYMLDNTLFARHMYPGTMGIGLKMPDVDTAPLYFALIGIGGGIGLILSYFIEKRYWDRHKND